MSFSTFHGRCAHFNTIALSIGYGHSGQLRQFPYNEYNAYKYMYAPIFIRVCVSVFFKTQKQDRCFQANYIQTACTRHSAHLITVDRNYPYVMFKRVYVYGMRSNDIHARLVYVRTGHSSESNETTINCSELTHRPKISFANQATWLRPGKLAVASIVSGKMQRQRNVNCTIFRLSRNS